MNCRFDNGGINNSLTDKNRQVFVIGTFRPTEIGCFCPTQNGRFRPTLTEMPVNLRTMESLFAKHSSKPYNPKLALCILHQWHDRSLGPRFRQNQSSL